MLTLMLGRAGSGKTSHLLKELSGEARAGREGNILIVPEQYSHDCERALASMGDEVCLYCEVLSFTRLAARVFAQTGGMAEPTLDQGGRILAMSRAVMSVSSHLKVYNVGGRRPDFLTGLIAAYDELRSSGAGSAALSDASERAEGTLKNKLADLSLIFEAFDGVKERSGVDTRDRMERLAADIGRSDVGDRGRIFIDGFTDFTFQEFRVVEELLKKGADVTVALTCGGLADDSPAFRLPLKTTRRLMAAASENRVDTRLVSFPARKEGRAPALRYLERGLFDYAGGVFEGENGPISVLRASGVAEECAAAAHRVLELVRGGCRFRDIAVVSPNFAAYASILRGIFQKYGVPFSETGVSDILEKPVLAFILSALDIIRNNWDYVNVFTYLKTGLAPLAVEERDLLENYVLKWNLRGESVWSREKWLMHPRGYSEELTDREREELERINELKERIAAPVLALSRALRGGESALSKVRALYVFMEDTGLYAALQKKANLLRENGRGETAEEYGQLWDILVGALQQFADLLGEQTLETEEFIRLLRLVLSQYKVGVIPASVDSVRTGDMNRIRARGIRHLIILGATDDALPQRRRDSGVFSEDERETLRDWGIELLEGREDALTRESAGIYASLTVPTESLTFIYPASARRSYIVTRVMRMFDLQEETPGEEICLSAASPAFELAASSESELARGTRRYFEEREEYRDKLRAIDLTVAGNRGRLHRMTAQRLYGRELRLSASQIDQFYSCRYAYFLQYGLRLKARSEAALDAPEVGTFMHFILERSAREIERRGGFGSVTWADLLLLVPGFAAEYAEKKLGGLENKSGRFKYLFDRLVKTAVQVVDNMRRELRDSDFKPVDFELRFAPDGELPSIELGDGTKVSGVVDRVDGWVRGNKLYLRVVDYKTGKKAMDLRDVLYGMNLQMLIYLFALEREGGGRYEREIVPAGVLYSPARDELVRADRDLDEETLDKKRQALLKYSGLLLADPEVLEAMEHGGRKLLPVSVRSKTGEITGSIASLERLGKLGKTVDRLITDMAKEVREGSIQANPTLRGMTESACVYCKYAEACRFKDGDHGESYRRLSALKTPEVWKIIEEEADHERT